MNRDVNEALDQSLTLLQTGQATLEECLSRWPKHAEELRPLLKVTLQVYRLPVPNASPAATAAARKKMLDALAEKKRLQTARAHPPFRSADGMVGRIIESIKNYCSWSVSYRRLALATVLTLVLLALGGLLLPSWLKPTVAQAAALGEVSGTVEILPAGGDAWQRVFPGDRVEAGDRIRTGPRSSAVLDFSDGSTTDLGANCRIVVARMQFGKDGLAEVIVLRQMRGETYNRVQQLSDKLARFEIWTPSAVAVVSGTEFGLSVEPDGTTRVVVNKGVVKVTAQEITVAVSAGEETAVQPERPPNPSRPAQKNRTPKPTKKESPGPQKTKEPPGKTKTPQPPGQDKTPKELDRTKRPQPPGLEKTKEPPGQIKNQTRTPKRREKQKSPRPGKALGPSGPAKKPPPTGRGKTTQAPGPNNRPKPSKHPKKP